MMDVKYLKCQLTLSLKYFVITKKNNYESIRWNSTTFNTGHLVKMGVYDLLVNKKMSDEIKSRRHGKGAVKTAIQQHLRPTFAKMIETWMKESKKHLNVETEN